MIRFFTTLHEFWPFIVHQDEGDVLTLSLLVATFVVANSLDPDQDPDLEPNHLTL